MIHMSSVSGETFVTVMGDLMAMFTSLHKLIRLATLLASLAKPVGNVGDLMAMCTSLHKLLRLATVLASLAKQAENVTTA